MTARMATPDRRTPQGTAAGVLDTIADAVTFVLQRPWLMLVPLMVDLVLWLVLRVSMAPVIDRMIEVIESSRVEGYSQVVEALRENSSEVMVTDYVGAFVPSLFAGMPIDTLMGGLMMMVAPEGFGIPRAGIYEAWRFGFVDTFVPGDVGTVFLAGIGSILASSVALVMFRVPMARAIRGTAPDPLAKELVASFARFLGYLVLLVVLVCVSIVPLMVLTSLAAIMGLGLGFVVVMALFIFGSMVGIYTYFTVDALLIHRSSPIAAFKVSYAVARRYFAQIARFALTSIFLMLASGRLWSEITDTAPGMIIALVGNAFVGTVLAAASMLYYTDRYRLYRAAEAGTRRPPQ